MTKLLLSSVVVLLSLGTLRAEEFSAMGHSTAKKESSKSQAQQSAQEEKIEQGSKSQKSSEDSGTQQDDSVAEGVTDESVSSDAEAATDEEMSPMVRRGGHSSGHHGYRRGGGTHGGSRMGWYRGGRWDRWDRGRWYGSSRGWYGGYHRRSGWNNSWRWNRNYRPRWYSGGYSFPRYYRYANIPATYYQCTAFDGYYSYSAGGSSLREAAFNALTTCGGYGYEYRGCYIPAGYCRQY